MVEACRVPRSVSVVVAVLLLCLGVVCLSLLSLTVSGSEGSSALGMANVLHVDQGTNGNAPPLDVTYPFALAEEADKDSVNAGLLAMLFLAASFFGASAGRPLTNVQSQGALCFSSLGVIGEVLGSTREDYLPFLGVFRL